MAAEHKKMGVIACTAVVAGNMMGSGIALLPANLASIGSISLIGWGVALIGALALAYVYSRLGMEDPQEGGPIAYSGEVAPILGYQSGLLYYHANWIGNLAIAITGVDYLSVFSGPAGPGGFRTDFYCSHLGFYRDQYSRCRLDRSPCLRRRCASSDSCRHYRNRRLGVF